MSALDVLGWCGAIASVCISLPQFLLVVRTKRTHGLALIAWVIALGTGIGWLDHGIKLMSLQQIVCNTWGIAVTVVILWFLYRNGRYRSWLTLLPGLVLGAVLATVDWRIGSAAFGLLIIIPQAFGMARQGITLMRAPLVNGVAIPTWFAQVCNQAIWLGWGLLAHDAGIQISSSVSLVAASFVLTLRLLRASGRGPWLKAVPSGGGQWRGLAAHLTR